MNGLLIDFEIALRSLVQHRKRTLLLGGAIAGVTALLVLLLALAAGIQHTMVRSATTLSSGHLNVGGFYKVSAGQSAPVVTDFKQVEDVVRQALPDELLSMSDRGRGWAKLVSESGSMQVGVGGITIANEPAFREVVQILEGDVGHLSEPGTLLLFEDQAKKLEVKVGDAVTLSAPTTRGVNNTVDLRVVAIARSMGLLSSWNTFVHAGTLSELYQLNKNATGGVLVYLKENRDLTAVAARLRQALEKAGYRVMEADPRAFFMKFDTVNREDWTGQKLDVTTWEDEISFISWTLKALNGLSVLLISVLLVIVVIGIMNTMWIAIRERTREIGTLRAIGMQRRRVSWMFLCEAGLLGLLGTLVGTAIGAVVAAGVNAAGIEVPMAAQMFLLSDRLTLTVVPSTAVSAVVAITLVTMLAAIYPAWRAARLKPVTAMHHIG